MSTASNLFQESLQLLPGPEQLSLDITIGCEFEFLLVYCDEEPPYLDRSSEYGRKLILENPASTASDRMRML